MHIDVKRWLVVVHHKNKSAFILIFIPMTIKLLIIGNASYETIELAEGTTVEQLALQKNLVGEFKRVGQGVLQATDVLVDGSTITFAAGSTRVVTNVDGTTSQVTTVKKISWAVNDSNNEGLVKVRFTKTVVERELSLPAWVTVKEALDMANIRRGNIVINGVAAGFAQAIDTDTTIELSVPAATAAQTEEEDEDDDY